MRIKSLHLQNFKRFTDLRIEDIPETAKLVLLIGANGCGKSSVFDAFYVFGRKFQGEQFADGHYYAKNAQGGRAEMTTIPKAEDISFFTYGANSPGGSHSNSERFFGRPSVRIIPRIDRNIKPDQIAIDGDRPLTFIDADSRFSNDVYQFMQQIDNAIREPVFKGKNADVFRIFQENIQPLNESLKNIFGSSADTTIELVEYLNMTPETNAQLVFQKGESKIGYDLLSHGEKQVVILLLNFIVRKQYYEDAIIFIDEMDAHLNTSLQQALLHEIVTRWIPDSSQFWTASHALGFIDYARKSPEAAIIDFDALDFDQPQIIRPTPKENFEVFEVAVSKELLTEIFQDRKIIFAENTDAALYNNLSVSPYVFFKANDKLSVFIRASQLHALGLIDRDYLSDEERELMMETYPYLRILPYYSSENLLYHPDNLEEYFSGKGIAFDKEDYIARLTTAKNEALLILVAGLIKAREGYPFYRENEHDKKQKAFRAEYEDVIQMLQSNDFETFYKVFPAKDYGKTIPTRQNLAKTDLASTRWFKAQVAKCLEKLSLIRKAAL